MSVVTQPVAVFNDKSGDPLDNGSIYIGVAGSDARTNPLTVYRDAALTIPWSQPIGTVAGFPAYQGAPSAIYVAADTASITTLQNDGQVVLNMETFSNFITAADLSANPGIFRAGLRPGYLHSDGPISVGTASVANRSFDTVILAARRVTSPSDNTHIISTSNAYDQMNGFAFAEYDARTIVNGTTGGNHIAGYQVGTEWNSTGTLDDFYSFFAGPIITKGICTRLFGLFYQPVVTSPGSVTQHVALNVPNLPEYTNPGSPSTSNTNYVFRAIGGKARGRIDGQISAGKFHVGNFEGGAIEAYTVFIDGTDNAYTYYGQSGVWNWRTGMTKDQTSFYIRGNNVVGLEMTAVSNHVLPGADGTQNLGSGSKQWNNIYLINAPIVSSDERFKTDVAPLSEAEIAWSKAIATVRYRLIADPDKLQIGVIAQQVYAAGIAAGIEDPFAYNFLTQTDDRLAIRYEQLLAFIVAGQEARIAQLETK